MSPVVNCLDQMYGIGMREVRVEAFCFEIECAWLEHAWIPIDSLDSSPTSSSVHE